MLGLALIRRNLDVRILISLFLMLFLDSFVVLALTLKHDVIWRRLGNPLRFLIYHTLLVRIRFHFRVNSLFLLLWRGIFLVRVYRHILLTRIHFFTLCRKKWLQRLLLLHWIFFSFLEFWNYLWFRLNLRRFTKSFSHFILLVVYFALYWCGYFILCWR